MLVRLLILTVLLTLWGCVCEEKTESLRVVGGGGKEARGRFSWVVRLVQHQGEVAACGEDAGGGGGGYGVICSGSLLNHNWVLAAGHCADASHVQLNTQPAARDEDTKGVLFRKILQVHVHPAYMYRDTFTRGRLENDIALYETEDIKMKDYGKLDCRDFPALFGREVYFVGYGLTKYAAQYENSEEKNRDLKRGPLMYGTGLFGDCTTAKYQGSLKHMSLYFNFCVMRKCSNFALLSERDMGGPVVVDDKIAGVNTIIIEDRNRGPSEDLVSVVATPISPYIDWIQNLAKKSATDFY